MEKAVAGLAERIISKDESRRAQDLVSCMIHLTVALNFIPMAGFVQYRTKTAKLGFEARHAEEACEVG